MCVRAIFRCTLCAFRSIEKKNQFHLNALRLITSAVLINTIKLYYLIHFFRLKLDGSKESERNRKKEMKIKQGRPWLRSWLRISHRMASLRRKKWFPFRMEWTFFFIKIVTIQNLWVLSCKSYLASWVAWHFCRFTFFFVRLFTCLTNVFTKLKKSRFPDANKF